MTDGIDSSSPILFGPRVCAISIILVSPLSRSAIAIALLLVPRSIARLKRALMREGLSWLSCCQFASIAARDGKHQLYVIRLGRPAAGRCQPAYLSSTSAGAIAGSRSVELRKTRGRFTASVFHPWWTSTPENGAGPLILPSSRYSSGE